MEIKHLTFQITCVNRIFEMNEHSDKSELYLNGVLRNSSDYVDREADEPIHIQYYGKTHNIADLHALVSVRKRPPRSEVPGIACTEPWTSNDEPTSFLFAYLSKVSVRMVSMSEQKEETENE